MRDTPAARWHPASADPSRAVNVDVQTRRHALGRRATSSTDTGPIPSQCIDIQHQTPATRHERMRIATLPQRWREGTRTPRTPRSETRAFSVELLTSYSHSAQAADLRLCHTTALTNPVRASRPSTKRPWSLRDRLDERDIAGLITTYRDGATAASLATTHGANLSSVKRLLHNAGVRRTQSTRRSTKVTPTATYP